MPFIFVAEIKYNEGKCILHSLKELVEKFPYIEGGILTGKFICTYIEGRRKSLNDDFKCHIIQRDKVFVGELLEPNPLRTKGIPISSNILIVAYKYEKESSPGEHIEYPILENLMIKSYIYIPFEEDIKKILKEEEAGLILEGTTFDQILEKSVALLKNALISFEQEKYSDMKTASRKCLEDFRGIVKEWETIDGSRSLCEKLNGILNSLYSFASIGGAHEGPTSREDSELILKHTTALLLYINSIKKNQREKYTYKIDTTR